MTPFNIGRRIELHDFTPAEVAPLAAGLKGTTSQTEAVIGRVMHWTGGHPYLTQKLCAELAAQEATITVADVDAMCQKRFYLRADETAMTIWCSCVNEPFAAPATWQQRYKRIKPSTRTEPPPHILIRIP